MQIYVTNGHAPKWRMLGAFLERTRSFGSGFSRGRVREEGSRARFYRVSALNLIRTLIIRLDKHISHRLEIQSFSADFRCLFRAALARAPRALHQPHGTPAAQESRIIELHLWNEHIPPLPASGPNLAWGRELCARLDLSMTLLADAVRSDPHYRGVVACRARTNFAGPGCPTESITRLIERCGFHDVEEGSPTVGMRIHDACENLLIAALVWAHNPHALCRRKFRRVRRPVWISREDLLTRYPAR